MTENPVLRFPLWMVPVWLALGAFVLIFFIRTGDAMILIFGLLAILMLAFVWLALVFGGAALGALQQSGAGAPEVRVRCGECRTLNPEAANYCNECGHNLGGSR